MLEFDIVVIGGGPGGYVAAIKAAQLGLKVACVEKRGTLGGTCLNVGCIPSKALLHSSHLYAEAKKGMGEHGINISSVELDLAKMMKRKESVVTSLCKGIEGLFAKNKVHYVKGKATINTPTEVKVDDEILKTKNIIIATGSEVITLPGVEIDEKSIISSTGALVLEKVPARMLVIGGGYIGLEMTSVWSRLGSKVTVAEFADKILANMDHDLSKEMKKIFEADGVEFKLKTKVISGKVSKGGVSVQLQSVDSQEIHEQEYDIVLVCVGRKPYTEGLGLENVGIVPDARGKILVNEKLQTNVKNIYAIGDVTSGPMLAHKAEEEGVAVAETIKGEHGHVNYDAIPGIVYTHPEAASVGKTEDELKKAGIAYKVGKFPFTANSRARAIGESMGFVKILTDASTDKILGAHIIGASAGDLIQELVLGMEFGMSAEDLARTSHGHPGLSEAVKEASFAAFNKPIHM